MQHQQNLLKPQKKSEMTKEKAPCWFLFCFYFFFWSKITKLITFRDVFLQLVAELWIYRSQLGLLWVGSWEVV